MNHQRPGSFFLLGLGTVRFRVHHAPEVRLCASSQVDVVHAFQELWMYICKPRRTVPLGMVFSTACTISGLWPTSKTQHQTGCCEVGRGETGPATSPRLLRGFVKIIVCRSSSRLSTFWRSSMLGFGRKGYKYHRRDDYCSTTFSRVGRMPPSRWP